MHSTSSYILLLIPLIFGVLAKKYKNNTMYWPMALFYSIGGFFAYLLTNQSYFQHSNNFGHQDISFFATFYLICCFIVIFEPIKRNRLGYDYNGLINIPNLKKFCNVFIVMSALYILFIFPHVNYALNVRDAVEFHDELLEKGGLDISGGNPFLFTLFSFQAHLRPIFTFLFGFMLSDSRFKSWYKVLLGACCILPPILQSMANSNRNVIVYAFIDFMLCFLLFYKQYTPIVRKWIVITSSVVGAFVGIIILIFAFMRFSDTSGGNLVVYSLYRYIGEPFVNFNTQLWDNGYLLWGNKSFTSIREFLGMDFIPISKQRLILTYLPYHIYYFYSFVGNFYMDYGFWGGIILCLSISYVFNKLINRFFHYNTITRLLVIFLYVSFTIRNYFYFVFMGANNMLFVWYCVFVFIIYSFVDRGVER